MRLYILTILTLIFITPVQAAELHGLAMHGAPKYDVTATHLEYVSPEALKGGTLKQAATGTFDTLNPYTLKGTAAKGLNLVYDRLMRRVWDEPFTMYPLIAEKIDVPEDRSTLTVFINPKARFHDGSAITADDVIFSFNTLKEQGRPNMRRIYKLVETVEKRDDLTVHFKFGEGYDEETVMIIAMMPVLSKAYWQNLNFEDTVLEPPLLNGPYQISYVDPGHRIVYRRTEDYWAKDLLPNVGHYNFDEVIFDYYRDDTVAFEAFKSGDLDIRREWNAGKWASSYDFPAISKGKVIAEDLKHGRSERVRAMIFNTRRTPFDDIKVRQALQFALDFDWLNKNLFHGQYKRINSYYPNSELAANNEAPAQRPSRQALRQASTLLKDAGWVVEEGALTKDGHPFKFEIIIGSQEDEKVALAFTRNLERLGITVIIRVLDSAAFLGRLNEYDYDMVMYHWQNSLSPGTEQMLYWTCEAKNEHGRWNYAGICDPAIDDLSAAIAQSKTRDDLVSNTKALDKLLMDGAYIIPLYYSDADHIAYKSNITHPEINPLYGMVIETWWEKHSGEKN